VHQVGRRAEKGHVCRRLAAAIHGQGLHT
jgi:hypothetical protein